MSTFQRCTRCKGKKTVLTANSTRICCPQCGGTGSEKAAAEEDGYLLRECPFKGCGAGDLDIMLIYQGGLGSYVAHYMVGCNKCDVKGPSADTPEQAVAAWNRRPCCAAQPGIRVAAPPAVNQRMVAPDKEVQQGGELGRLNKRMLGLVDGPGEGSGG